VIENTILTLIKSIGIMYFNNFSKDSNQSIYDEVRDSLIDIKVENNNASIGSEDSAIDALKSTAEWMLSQVVDTDFQFSRENLITRLKVNLVGNNFYIDTAIEMLRDVSMIEAEALTREMLTELRHNAKKERLRKAIQQANTELNFTQKVEDYKVFAQNMINMLEEHAVASGNDVGDLTGSISTDDPESIIRALEKSRDQFSDERTLKTGYQYLDRACGEHNGVARGYMVNFGALSHNYKSGILIDLCLNIPRYNEPVMIDDTKKPLILRISFENTVDQDILIMYKKLYEIEYKKRINIRDIDPYEAATYVSEYFSKLGYTFRLEHHDPGRLSAYDVVSIVDKYVQDGYEIHALVIDYLTLTADNTPGVNPDIRIMNGYQIVRNYCHPKAITCFTAHQLSTQAEERAREFPTTLTKVVRTGGWYQYCKGLHQKLDLEFVMHIVKHGDGRKYLTVSRGKHRGGELTPEAHLHFVYPFEEFGGIVPDHGKEEPGGLDKLPSIAADNLDDGWEDE